MIGWLQDWYSGRCDGDWEHSYGVRIGTLDNPGWQLDIALEGTELEGASFRKVDRHNSTDENDWTICWVESNYFRG